MDHADKYDGDSPDAKYQYMMRVDVCNWLSSTVPTNHMCHGCDKWVGVGWDYEMVVCDGCGFWMIVVDSRKCPVCGEVG